MNEKQSNLRNPTTYNCKRFVAVCDVLGFSQKVRTLALGNIIADYSELLGMNDLLHRLQLDMVHISEEQKSSIQFNYCVFSDTILVWSGEINGEDDWFKVRILIHFLNQLIVMSITSDFPLRIGIAFGDVIIGNQFKNPYTKNPISLFVGKPIVDAYAVQECSSWIGGVLHSSCTSFREFKEVFSESPLVAFYPVPYIQKSGFVIGAEDFRVAINWPRLIMLLEHGELSFGLRHKLLTKIVEFKNNIHIREIYENSLKFYEEIEKT